MVSSFLLACGSSYSCSLMLMLLFLLFLFLLFLLLLVVVLVACKWRWGRGGGSSGACNKELQKTTGYVATHAACFPGVKRQGDRGPRGGLRVP